MKVYYKPFLGIIFIFLGILILVLNIILLSAGQKVGLQMFMGIFLVVIGVFYLTKPYFELREKEIVLFNSFGMVVRRYPFSKRSDIQVADGNIYIQYKTQLTKVRLSPVLARTSQWQKFILSLSEGKTGPGFI